jgi:hypothetical protein
MFSLTACGGGSGGGGGVSTVPAGVVKAVSGVAATGAAINGEVYLKDRSVPPVVVHANINADGSYLFDVTEYSPPFYLKAVELDAFGSPTGREFYSIAVNSGVANINPLTNWVVSRAAGVMNPADVYTNALPVMIDDLNQAVAYVNNVLQSLLDVFGAAGDPINDNFIVGSSPLDLFLDSVTVVLETSTGEVTVSESTGAVDVVVTGNGMAAGLELLSIDTNTGELNYSFDRTILESSAIKSVQR